jgi:hypothetical protein
MRIREVVGRAALAAAAVVGALALVLLGNGGLGLYQVASLAKYVEWRGDLHPLAQRVDACRARRPPGPGPWVRDACACGGPRPARVEGCMVGPNYVAFPESEDPMTLLSGGVVGHAFVYAPDGPFAVAPVDPRVLDTAFGRVADLPGGWYYIELLGLD